MEKDEKNSVQGIAYRVQYKTYWVLVFLLLLLTCYLLLVALPASIFADSNCTEDTTYCEGARKIRKSGGYLDPSHSNADSKGCVYEFAVVGSCETGSIFANISKDLITGVQMPDADKIEELKNSNYSGVKWVKYQYPWAKANQAELDYWIDKSTSAGYQVLLSVAKKPKNIPEGEGYAEFSAFMEDLARRERGRVSAFEIWNEPNFRGEMEGFGENTPESYLKILKAGAEGVRRGNPDALVISAALAPLTDEYDDEKFIQELSDLGGLDLVDAIGWHSNVTENIPPDNTSMRGFQRVKIGLKYGKPVWITEFGWARDLAGIDRATQEKYIKKAFEIAPSLGNIKAMFVWNFGFGGTVDPSFAQWDIESEVSGGTSLANNLLLPSPSIRTYAQNLSDSCGADKNGFAIPCYKIGFFEEQALLATKAGAKQATENYLTYNKILSEIENYIASTSAFMRAKSYNLAGQEKANACLAQ